MHPEGCANDMEDERCTCGADEDNARNARLLALLDAQAAEVEVAREMAAWLDCYISDEIPPEDMPDGLGHIDSEAVRIRARWEEVSSAGT